MTEPASHAGFRDLARQALSRRTGIPAKTDWEVFLHGFASTNQLGGERERDIYECLLRTFPTPESVIDKDLRTLRNESGCQSLISPVNSADWMKRNAENWDNIRPLLRCRTRAEQDAIRNFIEDPQNQNKRLVKEFVGANYKGSDMTLLWGGCEVPVVDKQLIRYLAPTMLGTDWDSYIRDQLSERKSSGRKLKLGRRFSADQGQDIQATDIDVDDPTHRYAEEEAIVGKIQSTVGRYGAWRDLAYQMADAEGLPANIWHVATWLEYRIGGDPDSPRANPRTLAQGREFAGRTYAPSETPSAVTDDQMRYLNAEVNDRISYGLRNETVERGRGPAYILSWSNASAEWSVFARREKVGTTVRLDANQILGYGNQADLDEAAPLLNPLPLYTGSFEYREQGKQDPGAWADMTPEEQQRWREEAEIRSAEARRQIETQLGREMGYMDQDMWDVVMPTESLYQWTLPWPRGEFPQTPRLRETRKSIYYAPGWVKIRFYQVQNPHLTVGEIGRDIGYSVSYVSEALKGSNFAGQYYGPPLYAARTETTRKILTTKVERHGTEGGIPLPQKAEAVQTYVERPDLTVPQIAEMYGVDRNTILLWVGEAGVQMRRREEDITPSSPETKAAVIKAYVERPDLTMDEMVKMYGVSKRSIYNWVNQAGIPRERPRGPRPPSAFVGFETPFGFDDAITVMWQDWVQYKINDTPVVVRRVDTKPGTKVNPRYKGATAPKELQIDFRLRASNRKDMQKIDFLLERLREDNPNMTVKVNVKTNGQTARRNLPSWQDRPYRVVPSAEFGVFYTPEEHDPMIQKYGFWEVDLYEESDSPYVDAYFHEGTEVNDEGELLDEETYMSEDIGKAEFTSGETSLAEVVWDIDDVRVGISYGPWTSRLGEYIDHAAYVDISRYGGAPLGPEIFQPGGPIAKITNLLDGIHRANPNIRIVATATTDVEGRGDIRARIYERYGWRRIGVTDVSGSVDIELPHPNQRSSGSASAFTGIEEYASDIMELV